jgi:hypothetical protein
MKQPALLLIQAENSSDPYYVDIVDIEFLRSLSTRCRLVDDTVT